MGISQDFIILPGWFLEEEGSLRNHDSFLLCLKIQISEYCFFFEVLNIISLSYFSFIILFIELYFFPFVYSFL